MSPRQRESGMPERRSHDRARHGVISLSAAFNIADGTVISELRRQHRAVAFKKFLVAIDPRTRSRRYGTGSRATPGSMCISPRPDRRGSTRWNAGSGSWPIR